MKVCLVVPRFLENLWIPAFLQEFFGSHSAVIEVSGLHRCDTVSFGQWFLLFWRKRLPSFSKVRQPKEEFACWLFLDCLNLEGENTVFLWNIRNHPPIDTLSHPRKLDLPCSFTTSNSYFYMRNTAVKVSVRNQSDVSDFEMVTHTPWWFHNIYKKVGYNGITIMFIWLLHFLDSTICLEARHNFAVLIDW